jgi:hypothetical protein
MARCPSSNRETRRMGERLSRAIVTVSCDQHSETVTFRSALPPRPFEMDVARSGIAALDKLRRPTLVTCRTGPRSSALVYLYAGLRAGASADEVLTRAKSDGAPFIEAEPLGAWGRTGPRRTLLPIASQNSLTARLAIQQPLRESRYPPVKGRVRSLKRSDACGPRNRFRGASRPPAAVATATRQRRDSAAAGRSLCPEESRPMSAPAMPQSATTRLSGRTRFWRELRVCCSNCPRDPRLC